MQLVFFKRLALWQLVKAFLCNNNRKVKLCRYNCLMRWILEHCVFEFYQQDSMTGKSLTTLIFTVHTQNVEKVGILLIWGIRNVLRALLQSDLYTINLAIQLQDRYGDNSTWLDMFNNAMKLYSVTGDSIDCSRYSEDYWWVHL